LENVQLWMASNLPGGVETLGDELPRFMDIMNKAFVHLADATFSLVYFYGTNSALESNLKRASSW
jgi:hypothetical protein